MTDNELIDVLNHTEAERVRWMTAAITAGNDIAALKSQVNCLRDALDTLSRMAREDWIMCNAGEWEKGEDIVTPYDHIPGVY